MVRAKFRVISKGEDQFAHNVTLTPVVGKSEENKTFYKATPGGKIELSTINSSAAEQFKVGADYYVDFTPAE